MEFHRRNSLSYILPLISWAGFIAFSVSLEGADIKLAWDANNPAPDGYKVHIGTSSRTYSTSLDAHNMTVYTVTGLNPGTYFFAVTAYDTAGETGYSNEVTTTIKAVDSTPPVISSIACSSISSVGASISWTTNKVSDSQVEFGTTTSYGNSTPLNSSMTTSHSVKLNGLTGGTDYHFRVKSKDASGNLATSADGTFTTLLSAPTNVQTN
jgi:predicted phage tail protein